MTRILVVDDERDLSTLVKHTLERSLGAEVDVAESGDVALRLIATQTPDLIIVDLNVPILDGMELCRLLRTTPATADVRIIMLTARSTEHDCIAGLTLGADDYMTKPFSLPELTARVRALLRRSAVFDAQHAAPPSVYRGRHLAADFDAVSVAVDEVPVRLRRREFELLRYLVENRNRVVPRDRLLTRVWGYDASMDTRSVDVHIARLRGKLGRAGAQIETVVGLGYRFAE